MALVHCPDCGQKVSEKAPTCPHCGSPLKGGGIEKKKKKMGCLQIGCLGLILFGVIGVIGVIMEMNLTPEERAAKEERRKQDQAESAKRESERGAAEKAANRPTTVSPFKLVGDYEGNEVAADLTYKGKTLRISGSIDDIGKDILGTIYVTLEGGHVLRKVQVMFSDAYTNQVARLRKGMRITVVGRCQGLMMNVLIKDASIE